ncbi:metallophosphoesterase family protein [Paracoccus luteus]|uniref:metallophosphoesterase family protein n=1 Tax=Paracoccus luteus TaxID=2508543 RepID=UPI00106FE991|nr:metallophosphoesterase family protein [Paracoccus luteus]
MRIYAVGDIHGHLDLLRQVHRRIADDGGEDATIVHVGDLVDRGPDSRGVVDYLIEGQTRGRNWLVIKGNHDRMLPQFLRDPGYVDPGIKSGRPWIAHDNMGAAGTLASYGIADAYEREVASVHAEALARVPDHHVRWLDSLPAWHLTPLALFVHAGLRPGVDLRDQVQDDLLWIRKPFAQDARDHGVLVVHGHTPVRHPTHFGNRLNLDTGAAYGGPVSAVRLDADGGIWWLSDAGPRPVAPGAGDAHD